MNYARQNTTHYRGKRSLQDDRPLRELHLPMLPPRRRVTPSEYQMRKSHQDTDSRDTRLDSEMRKGVIMTRVSPYLALLICSLLVACAFIWCVGQASQSAYQEGLRAGKSSAQATAQAEAYNQGYERGYASALYEVGE